MLALNRDAEIIPLYISGKNAPQIKALLNVSTSHVYNVLRRHKIKPNPYNSGICSILSLEQKNDIIRLYLDGKSAAQLEKIFGVASHWIRRFLSRNGVKLRPRGERAGALSTKWRGGLTDNREYQRKKINSYNKKRRNADPLHKLKCNLLNRINASFKSHRYKKQSRTHLLLGASYEIVAKHIASRFKDGMNWENHGKGCGKWNFDHIIPLATAHTEEELLQLFHYKNIQPLWWIENMRKGSLHNGKRYRKSTKVKNAC